MEIHHQGFSVFLEDEWWVASGMSNFAAGSRAYKTDSQAFEIPIADIAPLSEMRRAIGVFRTNEDDGICARDRVLTILRGFLVGEPVPPIVVKNADSSAGFAYDLIDGSHRLHLSIAAGFTHIPAVRREW